MAAPVPPQGGPTPEQLQQMQAAMAAEARKRGMTPEQFQAQQRAQIETEAKAAGMTVQQYIQKLRADAIANHQRMQQQQAQQGGAGAPAQGQHQHQHQHQHQQQVPINQSGTPNPQAVALMKWLRGQDLKTRTCILNGQRKDMFRVKRALRAIESPAYAKASSKPKSNLPKVTTETPSAEVFKLLPLSLLALRVTKIADTPAPASSGGGKPKKRQKGLWTVRIEQQQDISPDLHYAFLAEAPSWKTQLYAVGALLAVFAVILFPLWPLKMRVGVWYVSMGMLGLIAAFFAMAIVRLILFVLTVFTVPPGLWIFPNLFEDVGFFDSFRPGWGWHETTEDKKAARKAKREARKARAEARAEKAKSKAAAKAEPQGAADEDEDDDNEEEEEDEANGGGVGQDGSGDEDEDDDESGIPANITVEGAKSTGADASGQGAGGGAVRRGLNARVEEGSDSE